MTERGRFADEAEARREAFHWIAFNNHRRRHRRAGMLSHATKTTIRRRPRPRRPGTRATVHHIEEGTRNCAIGSNASAIVLALGNVGSCHGCASPVDA